MGGHAPGLSRGNSVNALEDKDAQQVTPDLQKPLNKLKQTKITYYEHIEENFDLGWMCCRVGVGML